MKKKDRTLHILIEKVFYFLFDVKCGQNSSFNLLLSIFLLPYFFHNFFQICYCKEPRLGLSQLNDGIDRRRVPLQDEDHLGNDPHSVPGFPRLCSGMFRSALVSVGSREIRLIYTDHPKCGTLSRWTPGTVFCDSAFNLLRNLCDIFLVNTRNGRVLWLAVPWMILLCFSCNGCQLSFVSQRCHFWRENATQLWRLNYFVFVNKLEIITKMLLFKINN